MKELSIHVPRWVERPLSPTVNWAVSSPYPQSLSKRLALRSVAQLLVLLVWLRVVRFGGMGGSPPCKRSEADPALSSPRTFCTGRGPNSQSIANVSSCLEKQIGAIQ